MNAQRVNLAVWSVAVAVGLLAPAAVYVGFVAPLDSNPTASAVADHPRGQAPGVVATASVPSVDAFGPAVDRVLRPPLGPPTVASTPLEGAAAAAAVAITPPIQLQLVGTIGDAEAMIRGPDGTVALVEVGDDVDGAAVLAIGPSRVDLRQNGRVMSLQKPAATEPSGAVIR